MQYWKNSKKIHVYVSGVYYHVLLYYTSIVSFYDRSFYDDHFSTTDNQTNDKFNK